MWAGQHPFAKRAFGMHDSTSELGSYTFLWFCVFSSLTHLPGFVALSGPSNLHCPHKGIISTGQTASCPPPQMSLCQWLNTSGTFLGIIHHQSWTFSNLETLEGSSFTLNFSKHWIISFWYLFIVYIYFHCPAKFTLDWQIKTPYYCFSWKITYGLSWHQILIIRYNFIFRWIHFRLTPIAKQCGSLPV